LRLYEHLTNFKEKGVSVLVHKGTCAEMHH
jgi:hypothetical protein